MPTQCFVFIDVETDGPVPGEHSLLSLGAVACAPDGREIGHWYMRFTTLQDASPDIATMRWWDDFPAEFVEATREPENYVNAIWDFVEWTKSLPGQVVLVADPASFDGMFVNWYAVAVGGFKFEDLPWKHRVLDARTLRMALAPDSYHDAHQSKMAKALGIKFEGRPHVAIDDARHLARTTMPLLIGVGA